MGSLLLFFVGVVLAVGTPLGFLLSLTGRKPLPIHNLSKVYLDYPINPRFTPGLDVPGFPPGTKTTDLFTYPINGIDYTDRQESA